MLSSLPARLASMLVIGAVLSQPAPRAAASVGIATCSPVHYESERGALALYNAINSGRAGPIVGGGASCARYVDLLGQQFPEVFFEPSPVEHALVAKSAFHYDDPVFAPWQSRCPALAFNMWLVPEGARHLADGGPVGRLAYGRRDFRLYEVDADADAATPPDIIFYSARFYDYWTLVRREPGLPDAPPPADRNWNDIQSPRLVFAPDPFGDHDGAFSLIDLDRCRVHPLAWVTGIPGDIFNECLEPVYTDLLLIGDDVVIYQLTDVARHPTFQTLRLVRPTGDAGGWRGERVCEVVVPYSRLPMPP